MDKIILETLRNKVFEKQKILGKIYRAYGHIPIAEYVLNWRTSQAPRIEEFLPHVSTVAERIYGKQFAEQVIEQLKQSAIVSTIDHHGMLNHPIFINSNIIYGLRPASRIICFPTAGVSLNNTTSWSGCLLLHRQNQMHRFSFFRDRQKTQAVLATEAFSRSLADSLLERVEQELPKETTQKIRALTEDLIRSPVLDAKDFSTQASLVSTRLWSAIFPAAPQLAYVPLEELITRVIVKEIMPQADHILHRLFFTVEGWELVDTYFNGSLGAFAGSHKGSFLFWGVNARRRRVHLVRKGSKLVDHGLEIEANAARISQALDEGVLYPTSLACFLVLLYYGLTCVGGFNQVNWLTDIKNKYIALLQDQGLKDEAERTGQVVTDNFAEGTVAFLPNGNAATGLDIFLNNSKDWFKAYGRLAREMLVSESIDVQLPQIYKVITPASERNPDLSALTEDQIFQWIGLGKKVSFVLEDL